MRYPKLVIFACCFVVLAVHEAATRVQSSRRSVGGDQVHTHKYPWVIKLVSWYRLSDNLKAKRKLPLGTTMEPFRCTGFFIDKYGTVLTASHCVLSWNTFFDQDEERYYNLSHLELIYGTHTLNSSCYITEIKELSRIQYHHESMEYPRNPKDRIIDLAVIFVKLSEDKGMNCSDPTVGTIPLLSRTKVPDVPPNGTVAGFGKEAKFEDGKFVKLQCAQAMTEIELKYDGRIDQNWKRRWRIKYDRMDTPYFSGIGTGKKVIEIIVQRNLSQGEGKKNETIFLEGTCEGDSGGPYMTTEAVNGTALLHARGLVIGPGLRSEDKHDDIEQPCAKKGQANIMLDLNYWLTKTWISQVLRQRYEGMGVVSRNVSWDGKPITCRE